MIFEYDKSIDDKCWKEYRNFINRKKTVWGYVLPKENMVSPEHIRARLDNFNMAVRIPDLKKLLDVFSVIFNFEIKISDLKIFLITMPFSTYSEKEGWVAISVKTNAPLKTLAHELNHKFYFEKYGRYLPFEKHELYKEYLTVINNDVFKEFKIFDQGYPDHQIVREKVLKKWLEKKSIDECIAVITGNDDR